MRRAGSTLAKNISSDARRRVLVVACALVATACGRSSPTVDTARARSHVDVLAGRIGVRPIGSAANREAREYIAGILRDTGFAVRFQDAEAVDESRGVTARVVNIIATRGGVARDATALVSHYDSVPDGPGGSDDALGVATCLEAARLLAAEPLQHTLFVIVTDGEEAGLMGARAAVHDPAVAAQVRTFLNFDGTGAGGPTLLFEAGPGWGAPLTAWARHATAPVGASFGIEVYRRLPNDTDFSVFKMLPASGLNFAPIDDSYAYHTDRDTAARVQSDTIAHEVGNAVSTVRALDRAHWTTVGPSAVFFDLYGTGAVVYGETADRWIVRVAIGLAALAWLVLTRTLWRQGGVLGLVATAAWWLLISVAVSGAGFIAAWLIRALRAELTPWYAEPRWFFAWLIAAGFLGGYLARLLKWHAPQGIRGLEASGAVWWVVLPLWGTLTAVLDGTAPAAGYLFAWPTMIAGATVLVAHRSRFGMRLAATIVLLAANALWTRNTWLLLKFMVPLFGWLNVTTPLWLYPALIAVATLLLVPPVLELFTGAFKVAAIRRGLGVLALGLTSVFGVLVWVSPAYTTERPERRTVRYVQDNVTKRAWWEVAGTETAIDLGAPGPPGATWSRASDPVPASTPIAGIAAPFVYRTPVAPLLEARPGEVTTSVTPLPGNQARLDVTIVPRVPLTVRLTLAAGIRPVSSSVAGVVNGNSWRATYVAPPAPGLTLHLVVDEGAVARLSEASVVLITTGVSDASGGWPAWLPREHAAWHSTTVMIDTIGPDH